MKPSKRYIASPICPAMCLRKPPSLPLPLPLPLLLDLGIHRTIRQEDILPPPRQSNRESDPIMSTRMVLAEATPTMQGVIGN